MLNKPAAAKRKSGTALLVAAIILVAAIVIFVTLTKIAQNNTGGIGTQYIRNNNPSLLSTIIFGILSIKKQIQPLTLASMEAMQTPPVLQPSYPNATVQRIHSGGGIDLISVCNSRADKNHLIYFIHGGAWAGALNAGYLTFAMTLSQKTKYCVMLPEFGLLPSDHFPVALNELESAYEWLLAVDKPDKVVFGGDSSGANLSPALIFLLEQKHVPLPSAQFLLSPLADLTLSSPTFETRAFADPLLTVGFVRDAVNAYVENTANLKNPLISPIYGDFHNYPPTIIEVASQEIFLGDSIDLYNKIIADGSKAKLDIWKGLWHTFPITVNVPESGQSLDLTAQYINANS